MNREHSPYFFVSPASLQEPIVLEGDDAHHLAVVRRARPGDTIWVADGCGNVVEVSLATIDKDSVSGSVVTRRHIPKKQPTISVVQAMTKGAKVETIVQKLVELGIDRICVVSSDRSVVRWDEARRVKASSRLAAIGLEAAKQSHRAWLPQVLGPAGFELAVSEMEAAGLPLVAHPDARRRLGEVFEHPTDSIALAVGPEGGWSPNELDSLRAVGAVAVTVGDQILRTDTAPLVLASLVMHRSGRLG